MGGQDSVEVLREGAWSRSHYEIRGRWQIVREDGRLVLLLDEDFRTTGGPDVRVYLSPKLTWDLRDDNSGEDALEIGKLTNHFGATRLPLPDGTDLNGYQSLIIYSPMFRVLWGEASLLL